MKDFALSFFDGDSGAQLADYANVAMEHGIQFATTVSRGVTATVLALATIGEAAKTYLVFSGIVLFILSLVGGNRRVVKRERERERERERAGGETKHLLLHRVSLLCPSLGGALDGFCSREMNTLLQPLHWTASSSVVASGTSSTRN